MLRVLLAVASCVAAVGASPDAEPKQNTECKQAVDVVGSDIRLIRRLEVHAGSYLAVPLTGCGAAGCQNVEATVDLLGQGARMSVFGMTAPMMRNVQGGSPLVGLDGWSKSGARCFDVSGASTPPGADTFFLVVACDHVALPTTPEDNAADARQPRCSMDVALNYTASCPAHQSLSHDGSPHRTEQCGPGPGQALGGCEAPTSAALTASTKTLTPDGAFVVVADGCAGPGGCRDFNLSVLALGGSKVDVFHIQMNHTRPAVTPGNLTHLHLYGLLGGDWQTAEPLPSLVDAERRLGEAEVTADGESTAGGPADGSAQRGEDGAPLGSGLCPATPSIDGSGAVCEAVRASPQQPMQPAAALADALVSARAAKPGLPARSLAPSDPDVAALSRPVACFQRKGLAVPASAGEGVVTVVVCSAPVDGRCSFVVRQAYVPADGTDELSRAGRRLIEQRADQDVLQGTWEPERVPSAEEEADAAAAAQEAERVVEDQRKAEKAAKSPECVTFKAMRDAATGAPDAARADGPGRVLWTGSESLPGGATTVMEMAAGCRGRGECGDWRASAAIRGAAQGKTRGGEVRVWATTLSGHRNVTETGAGAVALADSRGVLPCSAASTAGRPWPGPASVDDGGVFWMVQCREPPRGLDACDLQYVIRRGD